MITDREDDLEVDGTKATEVASNDVRMTAMANILNCVTIEDGD